MLPDHYFHPMLVHFPVVLPFVIVGVILFSKDSTLIFRLCLFNALFACIAFYSGQWVGDEIAPQLDVHAADIFGWHAFLGRGTLFISVTLAIFSAVSRIATKHEQVFKGAVLLFAVFACIFAAIGGYTGGRLVHEFGVNSLL